MSYSITQLVTLKADADRYDTLRYYTVNIFDLRVGFVCTSSCSPAISFMFARSFSRTRQSRSSIRNDTRICNVRLGKRGGCITSLSKCVLVIISCVDVSLLVEQCNRERVMCALGNLLQRNSTSLHIYIFPSLCM